MQYELMRISSHRGPYPVHMCDSPTEALSVEPGSVALIDANVLRLYGPAVEAARFRTVISVNATEEAKTYHSIGNTIAMLLDSCIHRTSRVAVVGGGALQDIGCFAASILFRGISWEYVPTTLLAMSDSCIGSKSSVNFSGRKNQLGTFWPPSSIRIAPEFCRTLTSADIRSGYGEIIKLHLLEGPAAFADLKGDLLHDANDPANDWIPTARKWIEKSLTIKRRYIEEDERDTGIRRLLNYGHTFGHAYETVTDYALPHGIAVMFGIMAAAKIAHHIGELSLLRAEELVALLQDECWEHNAIVDGIEPKHLIEAVRHDKKATSDGVDMILLTSRGFRMIPVTFHEMAAALSSGANQ